MQNTGKIKSRFTFCRFVHIWDCRQNWLQKHTNKGWTSKMLLIDPKLNANSNELKYISSLQFTRNGDAKKCYDTYGTNDFSWTKSLWIELANSAKTVSLIPAPNFFPIQVFDILCNWHGTECAALPHGDGSCLGVRRRSSVDSFLQCFRRVTALHCSCGSAVGLDNLHARFHRAAQQAMTTGARPHYVKTVSWVLRRALARWFDGTSASESATPSGWDVLPTASVCEIR